MGNFSIIADVSETLLRSLREYLCPEPVQMPESIKLASPTDKNADFQLGLFLYDLREMSEYRASAPIRGTDDRRRIPPKPLTLHYMLFLNSKAQIAASAEVEQRILGRALQALSDNPIVDVSGLRPDTAGEEEAAAVTFLSLSFEDKTKIWTALSLPYQVAVYFSVSPVLLESQKEEPIVRVTRAQFVLEHQGKDK